MNKTNFKLFTMFLAGIAFSAMTVLAATISISTNFEDGVTQYLKKLVILKNDNNTGITLDGDTLTGKNIYGDNINGNTITGSSIYGEEGMFEKYCNYGGTGCVSYEELTQGGGESLWNTGSNNQIYYSTGNVGIGTGTPSEKLHVYGATQIGQSLKLFSNTDTNANPTIEALGNAKPIVFMTSGTESMRITASSKVGIGTNNPSAKLQVNGNVKFSSIGEGTGEFIIRDDPNGTDAMRVDMRNKRLIFDSNNDGYNVGIGTASPSSKLEVVGNTKISGDLNIKNNSLYVGGTNSYVGIGTGEPTAKLHIAKTWADGYLFKATDIGSKDRFWIHDGGDAYVDGWLGIGINPLKAQGNTQEHALLVNGTSYLSGNVGIGKNPSYKLDVAGTGYFEKGLIVDGTGLFSGIDATNGKFTNGHFGNNLQLSSTNNLYGKITFTGNLKFRSGTEHVMSINNSGNVKIGDNESARAKLDIDGGLMLGGDTCGNNDDVGKLSLIHYQGNYHKMLVICGYSGDSQNNRERIPIIFISGSGGGVFPTENGFPEIISGVAQLNPNP